MKELDIRKIKFAFIFGSVAKGVETPTSDVDLLIIGDEARITSYDLFQKQKEE